MRSESNANTEYKTQEHKNEEILWSKNTRSTKSKKKTKKRKKYKVQEVLRQWDGIVDYIN